MPRFDELGYRPDYASPPGETLRERLAEIDVSQTDLAIRAGLSAKHVNQIIHGHAPITPETSLALERVTDIPARIWSALESRYQEARMRQRTRGRLSAEDQRWMALLPIDRLRALGCIPPTSSSPGETFESLLSFFGVADREAWESVWLGRIASFKRSSAFRSEGPAIMAWLRIGELEARAIETAPFNPATFRKALDRVRALTRLRDFTGELVRQCAAAGVAVVFVSELGGERASGASRWLNPSRALIQLSDRYKRDDSFWFSFFHEAGHVLLHSKKQTFVHHGSEDESLEAEASAFAANTLIPKSMAGELQSLANEQDVIRFARSLGISPSIVVGRLQHEGFWAWNRGTKLKRGLHIEP